MSAEKPSTFRRMRAFRNSVDVRLAQIGPSGRCHFRIGRIDIQELSKVSCCFGAVFETCSA